MLTFIPDGYSLDGYVAESKRQHGAVKFHYRPMPSMTAALVTKKIQDSSIEEGESYAAQVMARQIEYWDVKTPDGKDVKVTSDACVRLQPHLAAKLFNIILGQRPTDEAPDQPRKLNDSDDLSELDLKPYPTQEEADAKNLSVA